MCVVWGVRGCEGVGTCANWHRLDYNPRTLNAIALHLVFPQKAAASFQNLQVVNNLLDRCFPMLYLSESRFQNWTRKWLLSDMHGCRRGTKIWPARSPSCGRRLRQHFQREGLWRED